MATAPHLVLLVLPDGLNLLDLAGPAEAFRTATLLAGTSPAAAVEALRVEAARRLLETSDLTVGAVARRVGLRSAEVLHRAFRRRVGTTPAAYRDHFNRLSA